MPTLSTGLLSSSHSHPPCPHPCPHPCTRMHTHAHPCTPMHTHAHPCTHMHRYERFLRIMMRSAVQRSSRPLKFWLLGNFLSSALRDTISSGALAAAVGAPVEYSWPSHMHMHMHVHMHMHLRMHMHVHMHMHLRMHRCLRGGRRVQLALPPALSTREAAADLGLQDPIPRRTLPAARRQGVGIHAYMHAYACACMCMYMHTYAYVHVHACSHSTSTRIIHVCRCIYIHMHAYAHTCIRAHVYACMQVIYVDSDQIVQGDLAELWDLPMTSGAPIAMTPFCREDPNAATSGFRFWSVS